MIANAVMRLRRAMAVGLVARRVTPNMLTVVGLVLAGIASACLAMGAGHAAPWEAHRTSTPTSWWPILTAGILTLAFASDMLDGAVARIANLESRFGAILDSTLDRLSDQLIFLGCAIHFCVVGNVTYMTLSITAAANGMLISYVKARSENFVESCSVGYWQRGERCVLFLLAAYLGHIPAALWLLGTLPFMTVIRRLRHTYAQVTGSAVWEPSGRIKSLMPWRHLRGSTGYDGCAGLVIAFLVAGPPLWLPLYGGSDPLRSLFDRLANGL